MSHPPPLRSPTRSARAEQPNVPQRNRRRVVVTQKRSVPGKTAPRSCAPCRRARSRGAILLAGIFTASGVLVCKNGLSPFARSAFADVPTGTPRSPLFGAARFSQRMPRLSVQTPMPLTRSANDEAVFPAGSGYHNAKRLSYHNDFSNFRRPCAQPVSQPDHQPGPDGRAPPGEFFAHQRWEEFFPKVGYVMSWGPCAPGTKFHPDFPDQNPNSVWCYGTGKFAQAACRRS